MAPSDESERAFQLIMEAVRREKGFAGCSYKPNYLKRRVAIRMRATETETYEDYLRVIREDPREIPQLIDRLTVHVTEFFRDPEVFEALSAMVFPGLEEQFGGEVWNAWSAGCSSGEEVYSMAIALREWRESKGGGEFHVDASDIDPTSIAVAEKGLFPLESIARMPMDRCNRWFLKSGRRMEVAPEIRRRTRFEVRDLMGPWEQETAHYHLVFCRNLLIYLTSVEHQILYDRFARVLRPGGYLVLGRTEALLGRGRLHFRCVDTRNRIYRRLD